MASLVLPNMTLGILVWYIDPPINILPGQLRPYHALTHSSTGPYSPCRCFNSIRTSTGTHSCCASIWTGGKAKRKEPKDKASQAPPTPKAPKQSPPFDFCKVVGNTTNNCPELPQLKPLVHETFPESNIPEVHVNLLGPSKKLKTLHTSHPYSLCDHHGHYSHCFPRLDEFCNFLEALRKYEVTHIGTPTPLLMDSSTHSQPK